MLQLGHKITQPNDPLSKIPMEELYKLIRNPSSPLAKQTEHLRHMLQIDPDAYRRNKTALPYITAGIFHPPYRRTEHFAAARIFIFDFDKFTDETALTQAAQQLKGDPRTVLLFRSPGGNGLKALFRLTNPCSDRHLYSEVYKTTLFRLASGCGIETHADFRTHDVTRACFLCHDPDVYCQPDAQSVDIDNIELKDDRAMQELVEQNTGEREAEAPVKPLTDHVLQQIKAKLNPNFRPRPEREVYVPETLVAAMPDIEKALNNVGIELIETRPIQYGKCIRAGRDAYWAEVNLFFGKRGFSVVKTTKTGSHPEMAQILYQVLYETLIQ